MRSNQAGINSIDSYIAAFPEDVQKVLMELRAIIRDAVPEAKETISYQMPAFALNGTLVYFAAWNRHIGFYPTSSGIKAFEQELSIYDCSKGAVRFPIDVPLPFDLIRRIVLYRAAENLRRAEEKASKRK